MPKILVCYKWVVDEQDIKVNPSDLSLDFSRAKRKINEYDLNGIEEGNLLAKKLGGSVDALTYGTSEVRQSLKDVHSRGPNKIFWIGDASAEKADAYVVANVLAAAIRKIGPYDLIICGEASSDSYNQQIAPRIAALLDWPAITYVRELRADGNVISATRKLTDCTEVATVKGPAVISVTGEINKPEVPGLKQVLAAGKKPSEEVKIADLGLSPQALTPKVVRSSVKGFVMNRKNVIYKEGDAAAKVTQLVASLEKEGVC
jgi:electron transfer flavoprotein beta subunit